MFNLKHNNTLEKFKLPIGNLLDRRSLKRSKLEKPARTVIILCTSGGMLVEELG